MATPILNLPVAPAGAVDLSVAFNEAMQIIEAFTPLVVRDKDVTTPPTTTSGDVGARWIIPTGATGVWAGHAGKIALCTAADVFAILTPPPFVVAYVQDESAEYRLISGTWTPL